MDLLRTKVYSKHLSEKILIFGSCIEKEYPETLEKLSKDYTPLSVCLEKDHMNIVFTKIISMVSLNKIKEIMILTQDGSPHCIGLHFVIEMVKNMAKSNNFNIKYCVLEHGELIEVTPEDVKTARHLSKIKNIKNELACFN